MSYYFPQNVPGTPQLSPFQFYVFVLMILILMVPSSTRTVHMCTDVGPFTRAGTTYQQSYAQRRDSPPFITINYNSSSINGGSLWDPPPPTLEYTWQFEKIWAPVLTVLHYKEKILGTKMRAAQIYGHKHTYLEDPSIIWPFKTIKW